MRNGSSIMMVEKTNKLLEKKFIDEQVKLQNDIDLKNVLHLYQVSIIAGVDLAYWSVDDNEFAACCIVVLDYKTREVIEKKYAVEKVEVPYIPGRLAFREIPVFMKAYEQLDNDIDVFFFDGNGYLHPRHMGLATHAGILINRPSIGVAKSYFKIDGVDFTMPANEQYSYTDIVIGNEVYGRVLRTHKDVKPIFLSIGNKIDLDTATQITNSLITNEGHIPLPTRLADIMTHEIRKKSLKEYERY